MMSCEIPALPLRVQRYAKFRIIPNHLLSFCTKFTFRLSMCKSWHSNMVLHHLGTFHGIRSWGWPHRCYNYAEGGRRAWSPVRLGDEVCRNGHFAASAALFHLFLCPRRGNAVSLHLKRPASLSRLSYFRALPLLEVNSTKRARVVMMRAPCFIG